MQLLRAALLATLLLSGCATVDFDYQREPSFVMDDTNDTYLARAVQPQEEGHGDDSGFYLLYDGIDALAARALLAERAEVSIDVQYYLLKTDPIGLAFIKVLLDAADRGVRVRILLDDVFTKGYDSSMAALASHPNIQFRIFNPFKYRNSRFLDGLTDFRRVNRRMHNKSFTVDNQVSVIGGRNIAGEYFSFREDVNFSDLDVVCIGPIVHEISAMFDLYWNNAAAIPVEAFPDDPKDPAEYLQSMRPELDKNMQELEKTEYVRTLKADIDAYISGDERKFIWAPFELAYDSPYKVDRKEAPNVEQITLALGDNIARAQSELIVISPYFVPLDVGVDYFAALVDRGLDVTVITNSLAANNHMIVHAGYASTRKAMLEAGVKLYEVKVDLKVSGVERAGSEAERATLHTKAFMIDERKFFVGSFNWDPRSANINTEMGVIMHSPEITALARKKVIESLEEFTYEVVLSPDGKLQWIDRSGDEDVVLHKEPDTSWWLRTKANMARILPIKRQL